MGLNKHYDYTDNFSEIVHSTRPIGAEELADIFFRAPQWIITLMKCRNTMVKPFGLKGEKKLSDLIKIESENVASLNKIDKHLDYEVMLITENLGNGNQRISVSTKVCLHNWLGKLYFAVIKPFHRLICKTLIKRVRRNLELS